jgi:hypothetical protein
MFMPGGQDSRCEIARIEVESELLMDRGARLETGNAELGVGWLPSSSESESRAIIMMMA